MDSRAINIAIKDIQDEYQHFISRNKIADTKEEFLKFLLNYSIIPQVQIKRFFVIKMIDKNISNNISVTETINTIEAEYDIKDRTCWEIRKNHLKDFRNKKLIS